MIDQELLGLVELLNSGANIATVVIAYALFKLDRRVMQLEHKSEKSG